MKYRAEIDGLRALAVLPVLLFHAGFKFFSGGFLGVDVFFVISGYLITSILIEEIENEEFSYLNFYERRARRILPALIFIIFSSLPLIFYFLDPENINSYFASLATVGIGLSNFYFLSQIDYFAKSAELQPLLHTWSLSVEEQYYLLFPLLLSIFLKTKKPRSLLILTVVASFILAEYGSSIQPERNFFFSFSRFWEIGIGSLAAFVLKEKKLSNGFLSIIGITAVIFSILFFDTEFKFPSHFSLLPVFGTFLIIVFASNDNLIGRFLSNKLLVGFGLISYSLYLWHHILFATVRHEKVYGLSDYEKYSLIIVSVIFAFLTWKFIERPFRNRSFLSSRKVLFFSVISLLATVIIGVSGTLLNKYYEKIWLDFQDVKKQRVYKILKKADTAYSNYGSDESNLSTWNELSECRFNKPDIDKKVAEKIKTCFKKYGPGILILGDSHGIDLFGVVSSRFKNPFIIGVTRGFCRPFIEDVNCHFIGVKHFVKNNPSIFKKIIFEEAGFYLLREKNGNSGSRKLFEDYAHNSSIPNYEPDIENINKTLEYLEKLSKYTKTIWFLPRAEPHISEKLIMKLGCENDYEFRENQFENFKSLDMFIKKTADKKNIPNIELVSQNEIMNFDLKSDFMNCDEIFWSDGDHYSTKGEIRFGQRLPEGFID